MILLMLFLLPSHQSVFATTTKARPANPDDVRVRALSVKQTPLDLHGDTSRDVPQKSHGNPVEAPRKRHGSHTETQVPWMSHESPMREAPWDSSETHVRPIEVPRKSHGSPMKVRWNSHRKSKEKPWDSHRSTSFIGVPWPPHGN